MVLHRERTSGELSTWSTPLLVVAGTALAFLLMVILGVVLGGVLAYSPLGEISPGLTWTLHLLGLAVAAGYAARRAARRGWLAGALVGAIYAGVLYVLRDVLALAIPAGSLGLAVLGAAMIGSVAGMLAKGL